MGYCSNKRTARDDLQQASSDPDTVGRVSVWCAMTRTDANLEDALPPGGGTKHPISILSRLHSPFQSMLTTVRNYDAITHMHMHVYIHPYT